MHRTVRRLWPSASCGVGTLSTYACVRAQVPSRFRHRHRARHVHVRCAHCLPHVLRLHTAAVAAQRPWSVGPSFKQSNITVYPRDESQVLSSACVCPCVAPSSLRRTHRHVHVCARVRARVCVWQSTSAHSSTRSLRTATSQTPLTSAVRPGIGPPSALSRLATGATLHLAPATDPHRPDRSAGYSLSTVSGALNRRVLS
jgi:hypothetical protein